ncbi:MULTISPECIES: 1,2-phenylacetyl-CoA epoxidase subunit PaaE [unclassified Crossiella]|uniref:1,2-phenylacetyl-CoA epoxidase subunit PaaE n=1 Tax=unclassified Crossiella TaxID=2620835 RepID=UPI001FFF7035|nr:MULTISPECIES: 1,2-phenylacetyl-CoA epoxidase subunit PaaE [unclassified Crossiella]MCK2236768.1 phenylacetate-CoA oxygenase/reductase subunit PaaK [Crossiella sp. S99.2]MCK2250436.1 phenylacetate-CoA oxygenase/reductase subunit PaaK [Crossiella sp. S99.1]
MAAPAMSRARAAFHTLEVARVDQLCADAVAVTLAVPDDLRAEFAFRPGQYLTLRRISPDGVEERRSYSICAPRGRAPQIGVRRVDGGLFSSWLVDELRAGDRIDVLPPSGGFSPTELGGHHVLLAAGSGITPVLSIAATLLADCPDSRVTLFYGNRRSDTVMFAEELADLKDAYRGRLQLVHVLSRERGDVELFAGRLDAGRIGKLLDLLVPVAEIAHWWLCGPYGMVTAAQQVLLDRAVPAERVHQELFYVDEPPPELNRVEESIVDSDAAEVVVLLDGRETVLALPRDTPILDAAQRVRADLPFACKGGVCGTCRAKVTVGEVRMRRNFALERHEVEAGFVLTCQALPVTDQVTVDFDA